MDLQKGTLQLYGMTYGPGLSAAAVQTQLEGKARGLLRGGSGVLNLREPVAINGHPCRVELNFTDGLAAGAVLYPVLESPPAGRMKAQALRRSLSEAILREALGEPDSRDEARTLYERSFGRVYTLSDFNPRNEGAGGYIALEYGGGHDQ